MSSGPKSRLIFAPLRHPSALLRTGFKAVPFQNTRNGAPLIEVTGTLTKQKKIYSLLQPVVNSILREESEVGSLEKAQLGQEGI